jgi:deoxyadenosine/deoxycytidine kinase
MDCFNAIYISSEEPAFKLHHAAYRLIFQAQLETILRREKIYAGSETIRDIEVEIKEIIASGEAESDLWMMYQDILQRAQLAQQGATSKKVTDMAELDKILARIKALRSKTVEQGCTEEEALLAANKVAEMLDHYGLSLTEMDIEQQQCASDIIETDRKRTAAFDSCLNAIAAFCDCRFWFQKSREDTYRHVFFGLPADVAGARYLYERISEAFKTETDAYKKSAAYLDLPSAVRRKATDSFQMGLARGLNDKIRRLKDERVQAMQKNAGRNLVVVKSKVIEDDLESLGIRLTATKKRGKSILPEAYESGLVSAETIDLHNRVSGVV